MGALDDIKVQLEGPLDEYHTANTRPVLQEIRFALDQLLAGGAPTVIDLSAMPFGPGDEEALLATLGNGEVQATLKAMGDSRVSETGYPGVWLVEHLSEDGKRLTLQVEITQVPDILKSQQEDIRDSARRLAEHLSKQDDSSHITQ